MASKTEHPQVFLTVLDVSHSIGFATQYKIELVAFFVLFENNCPYIA